MRQALRAGAVGVGQVGDRQFAALGVTGVAVGGQPLGPVPDQVAEFRRVIELVVQAQLGDAVDVAQRLGQLEVWMVLSASLEGLDDLLLVQALAARAAHRQDERKTELHVVVGVQLLDLLELLRRAVGQARLALLMRRFGRQRLANHRLPREFRVGADQFELRILAGVAHHLDQRELEVSEALERAFVRGLAGDPRRVLIHAVEQLGEFVFRRGVDLIQGDAHVVSQTKAVSGLKGCICFQWRAMSMRRGTQTRSCCSM